jgi:galactokinase/mevalonate kinase-like predicted kinase
MCRNDDTLKWIEERLWFINLSPRDKCFDVLSGTNINEAGTKALADAALCLWQAILDKDLVKFGLTFKASFEAQIAMFPHMVTPQITEAICKYEKLVRGWKISGAGGGGYLVLVSEKRVENAMQVRIRRM